MDTLTLFFIFIIPILFISFCFYLYSYYLKTNNQKIIINTLVNTNSKILDKSKVVFDEKDNFLKRKLSFAGFKAKGSVYTFIFISLAFGFLIGFFVLFVTKSKLIFIFTSAIFCFLPYLFLHKIIKVREEEFNFALKEMIDKVTNMMKSGVGFEQALKKSILTTKSELTKNIFNIYINEKSVIGEDKCFEKMFKQIESKELRIFYLVISIGRKSGGKFSNTLEKLRKTLHDQGEIKQEIISSTKEIKVGTYMIIGLVVFTYIMMNNALENALNEHFFGSDIGKVQMFFIIVWISFGLFINSLLTKIK